MKRFACKRCGTCCNNIQGNFKEEEIKEIRRVFGMLEREGIYLAVEPEKFSIPLFPYEARRMMDLAYKIGVDFSPVPKLFMIDARTDNCIVLEWDLGYSKCPFFDKNNCLIYNDRPLACQSFPVFPYSFSSSPNEYILLGRCPQVKEYEGLSKEEKEIIFKREIEAVSLYSRELIRHKKMREELIARGLLKPLIVEKEEAIRKIKKTKESERCISIDELMRVPGFEPG